MSWRAPLRWISIFLALFAWAWAPAAAASSEETGELPPRDVGVVVQPSAASLDTMPGDFDRIDRDWISLELPSSVRSRAEGLLRDADEARVQLSEDLGEPSLEHVLVRIARNPEQMASLAPQGAPPPAYAVGEAYPSMHVILLSLQTPDTWEAPDLSEVLRHELAHVALADATAGHVVPLWFNEGVAIHESGESYMKRWGVLWNASLSKHLIPLADLDRSFPPDRIDVGVAYAESADVVRFLMRDSDRARFGSLVQRVGAGVRFERALEDAYGTDAHTLEYQWREEVRRRFGLLPALTGGGVLWVLIAALSMAAWLRKRKQTAATLARWAREEAQASAAAAALADATSAPSSPPEMAGDAADVPRRPSVLVVEHEGRWYTLH